jgi:hypothetical protein
MKKSNYRIREEITPLPNGELYSSFFCEKKVLWFWTPVFGQDCDDGAPRVSFMTLEKAQTALDAHTGVRSIYYTANNGQ